VEMDTSQLTEFNFKVEEVIKIYPTPFNSNKSWSLVLVSNLA
jgi:hypothetical protein